jgi:hypothetical protein
MGDLDLGTENFKKIWTDPDNDNPRLFIPFYKPKPKNDEEQETSIEP